MMEDARVNGKFGTIIEDRVEFTGEESAELIFTVSKGEKIRVEKIYFEGAQTFKPSELEAAPLANCEADSFGWLPGRNTGEMNLPQLEYDAPRLKDFYLQHGYLDANVSDAFTKTDFNSYLAKIYYQIEEGKPYRVNNISVEFRGEEIDLTAMREEFKLQSGKIFDVEKMRRDITAIKDAVGEKGYAFARVIPDIDKDSGRQVADITYRIELGEKVYIRDVIISGNARTLDRVIRREVFLAPGDLYNLVEIKESRRALKRLGYFEDVTLEEERVAENRMDLVVKAKESPTGSLQAGGGYSSYSGIIFNASISDRNIFGSGKGLSFSIERSDVSKDFSLTLSDPRLNDSRYSVSTSLYNTTYEGLDYDKESQGGSLTIGRTFGRYWRGSLRAGIGENTYDYDENELDAVEQLFYKDGTTERISLTPAASFNNTDDYYVPRSGMIFGTSLEHAGLGGDEENTELNANFAYFYGLEDLIGWDLVLRYRFKGGVSWGDLDDLESYPLGSRLYLGGLSTTRGFVSNSIAPYYRDGNGNVVYDSSGDPKRIGGNRMISNNFELGFPLIPSARMRGLLFYDYGMIGEDSLDIRRRSVGVAMEWISPMGPLQFVWARPLNEEADDETSAFEFTMGGKF